jgi:hypothetical protein
VVAIVVMNFEHIIGGEGQSTARALAVLPFE